NTASWSAYIDEREYSLQSVRSLACRAGLDTQEPDAALRVKVDIAEPERARIGCHSCDDTAVCRKRLNSIGKAGVTHDLLVNHVADLGALVSTHQVDGQILSTYLLPIFHLAGKDHPQFVKRERSHRISDVHGDDCKFGSHRNFNQLRLAR